MKKFLTIVPQQETLDKYLYEAMDNSRLTYSEKTAFPLIPVINGYLKPEEDFMIIAVTADYEYTIRNREKLKMELKDVLQKNGIAYDEEKNFKSVEIPFADDINAQLEMFRKVVKAFDSGDDIYACITYGSKPSEIIEIMLLRYLRQIKRNCYISCIVYGQINRKIDEARIYDLTALLHLDDILVAASDLENAEQFIENLTL